MSAGPPFPNLTPENHRVTSPATREYNCIAWAAGDTEHWWEPGEFWPCDTRAGEYGLTALEQAFRSQGYEPCENGVPETGFEKVALYGDALLFTHAARQLPNGKWSSKLGQAEDIEHETPEDVAGGAYGPVAMFMRRLASGELSA